MDWFHLAEDGQNSRAVVDMVSYMLGVFCLAGEVLFLKKGSSRWSH